MKRNAIKELIIWKDSTKEKPIALHGIKGVGKTYLALEFAKRFYDQYIYVNFERDACVCIFFQTKQENIEKKNFLELLCEYLEVPFEYADKLFFILDELPACKEAFSCFTEFVSSHFGYSLLLITSDSSISYKDSYQWLSLYPFTFDEFLSAIGYEWYVEVIKAHFKTQKPLPGIVHEELLSHMMDYLRIGGLPVAINEYIAMDSFDNISEVHTSFFQNLLNYSYIPFEERSKVQQILNATGEQLLKENRKFQFRTIRKGLTYNFYSAAFQIIENMQLEIFCKKWPLNAENKTQNSFRLYFPDTGLLHSKLLENPVSFHITPKEKQKILFENYIIQELFAKKDKLYFWESGARAKVDFLIDREGCMIPLEIKTDDRSKAKSISIFQQYQPAPYSIRIGNKNYARQKTMFELPYYAVFCM